MHQETLLYMWHRLPFAQKKKPSGYQPRTEGTSPRVEWCEVPAGRATLGVDRGTIPFGWDNEFPASSAQVPAFAIERHDVTNATLPGIRRRRRLSRRAMVERRQLAVDPDRRRRASAVLGARGRRVVLARHVRADPAAAVVAGVRQPGGSVGIRAMERRAPADRSRVSARRLRLNGR